MIEFFKGIPIQVNNIVEKEDKQEKYYISYNNSTRDYGCTTTALVRQDLEHDIFLILKGNHTEEYNKCSNLNECIEYFKSQKDLIHPMSDDIDGKNVFELYEHINNMVK